MATRSPVRSGLRLVAIAFGALATPVAAQLDPPVFLQAPDPQQLVDDLRAAAAAMPYFEVGQLAYGRKSWSASADERNRSDAAITAALRLTGLPERLQELVGDRDPKVRTLAAYALYRTSDARYLLVLGQLTVDPAELPARQHLVGTTGPDDVARYHREHPEACVTTVGREVSSWLAMWEGPEPDSPAFAEWAARQVRFAPTTASLRVGLKLATEGTLGNHGSFVYPLLDMMRRVAVAPVGAREIATIGMFHDETQTLAAVYPSLGAHLRFAARRLGHDNLFRLLRGEAPEFDGAPLAPEQFVGFTREVRAFVLDNATEVGLGPDDAEALLALGEANDDLAYLRAAAKLRPTEAGTILRAALARPSHAFNAYEQLRCATLLWELAPQDSADFLVDWALAHDATVPRMYPSRLGAFAEHVLARYGAEDRRLFARLAADARFEHASPETLKSILRWLNQTRLTPLVSDDELSDLMHPFGTDSAWYDLQKARATHPQATERMLARMADWRQRIVEFVRPWRDG